MNRKINFFGLGVEMGQNHRGLLSSPDYVKGFFPWLKNLGLELCDRGGIRHGPDCFPKIGSCRDLRELNSEPYREAYMRIQKLLRLEEPIVNWGGDHSVGLSTVGAFSLLYPKGCVLWIDAHADLNLPQYSPTGNLHGMPLSILLNLENIKARCFPWLEGSLSAKNLIYLGIRDLDPFEENAIRLLGIKAYTSQDVRKRGMHLIAEEIMEYVEDRDLHISFDIDSLSPQWAPATGVSSPEGLSIEDLRILARILSRHKKTRSMDVVEINPELGTEKEVLQTFLSAFHFLIPLFYQGGLHDRIHWSDQEFDPAPLEQAAQVQTENHVSG